MKTTRLLLFGVCFTGAISFSLQGEPNSALTLTGRTAPEILENGETCYIWTHVFEAPVSLALVENSGDDALIVLPDAADWQAAQEIMNGTLKQFMRTVRRFIKKYGREPQLLEVFPEQRESIASEPSEEIRQLFQTLTHIIVVSFEAPTDFSLTLLPSKQPATAITETPKTPKIRN